MIARSWLSMVRHDGNRRNTALADVSDDDSSESEGLNIAGINVGPKARAIAKQWLREVRNSGRIQGGQGGGISDDDSSSDSSEASMINPPPQLSSKARAIALAWLRSIRQ
ncbi:hypothetical protein GUITHDRAFT_153680 [Guillardia theta CCMP2712]|uniref:Uncharacterized protein n=2 Tax=Guillardia theta TaxID=55529 RepID=L1J057_GUITC|nr:hypothetical protein GUITHDRAFT_153680 [Guillardia theta CCMP2712]EKX41903.1 hypothetical protein GUITHDRAFT_153680 [Guillardia theta CCMP2712]|eukprot:XP_005828883.1 hypothetical protein GUITHDRAFT_153680 [Guillardia theta CCMP2712]